MTDVGDIFDDNFFGDIVDKLKDSFEQHKKQECLKECHRQG